MRQADQSEDGKDDYSARATTRHDLLESILPLPDQILKIGTGFGPATPGAAPAAVTVLRWHWNVLSWLYRVSSCVCFGLPGPPPIDRSPTLPDPQLQAGRCGC